MVSREWRPVTDLLSNRQIVYTRVISSRQTNRPKKRKKEGEIVTPSFPFQVEKPSSFVHTDGVPLRHITGRTGWWCSFAKEIDFLTSSTFQVHYPCIQYPSFMNIYHIFYLLIFLVFFIKNHLLLNNFLTFNNCLILYGCSSFFVITS